MGKEVQVYKLRHTDTFCCIMDANIPLAKTAHLASSPPMEQEIIFSHWIMGRWDYF
jgi:hypothetical protein